MPCLLADGLTECCGRPILLHVVAWGLRAGKRCGSTPAGIDPAACHLIGPFNRDPRQWMRQNWHDTHSGTICQIACHPSTSDRVARVKSVAYVIEEHGSHTESKSAEASGHSMSEMTVGALERRHVMPVNFFRLGKESNQLEAVQRGEVRDLGAVQEKLKDPQGTYWDTVCLPILNEVPARELAAETGTAESLIIRYRKGLVKPNGANLRRLIGALRGSLRPPPSTILLLDEDCPQSERVPPCPLMRRQEWPHSPEASHLVEVDERKP